MLTFINFLKLFIVTFISLVCIDYIWIGIIAHKLYDTELGSLARRVNGVMTPNIPAGLIVYCILALGIILFVIPKIASGNIFDALLWGALFGLVTYGIYDITNITIISGYSFKIAVIDIVWGCVLCGIVSVITSALSKIII